MFRIALMAIVFLTTSILTTSAFATTDYRAMMTGQWQCQSYLQTDYGNTLVVGEVTLANNGSLSGEGNLALKHPSFSTEIPLAFKITGEWLLFKKQLLASNVDGQLYSESPVLNSIARAIQQQIGTISFFAVELKALGASTMVLTGDNNTDIECVRKNDE